jgi:Protein of unknown function (DUF1236)
MNVVSSTVHLRGRTHVRLLLAAATAAVMISGAAFAQTSTTTTTTTTTINPTEEGAIRTYVTREHTESIPPPPGFSVAEGAVVPPTVELHTLPSTVGVPYSYSVIGGQTVVVNPGNREVVGVVP